MIPGASTVNFDEISKEKIFDSINKANMQKLTDLKKDYQNLKNKIGQIPSMVDFINYGSREPWLFASYKKSYLNFINIVEDEYKGTISAKLSKLLEFFTLDINNGKRVEESLLLGLLTHKPIVPRSQLLDLIFSDYGYKVNEKTFESIVNNLNFIFIRQSFDIVRYDGENFTLGNDLSEGLGMK